MARKRTGHVLGGRNGKTPREADTFGQRVEQSRVIRCRTYLETLARTVKIVEIARDRRLGTKYGVTYVAGRCFRGGGVRAFTKTADGFLGHQSITFGRAVLFFIFRPSGTYVLTLVNICRRAPRSRRSIATPTDRSVTHRRTCVSWYTRRGKSSRDE